MGCGEGIWNWWKLINGVTSFSKAANTCVEVNGKLRESFRIHEGVRQGCVMSLWLFNLFMDGIVRDESNGEAHLCIDETKWQQNTMLFVDNTLLIAKHVRVTKTGK